MLATRHTRRQVIARLRKAHDQGGFGLTVDHANKVVDYVLDEWGRIAGEERDKLRADAKRSLDALYRKSFEDKQYHVCVSIERLRAEIDGLIGSAARSNPRDKGTSAGDVIVADVDNDFMDRSPAENEFFSEHGYFPELN
jgi:hypothetical protein